MSAVLISFTSALFGLLIYFIVAITAVNDVSVVPQLLFPTSRDVLFPTSRDVIRCNDISRCQIRYSVLLV